MPAERIGGYDAALFDRLAAIENRSFWFRARNRLIVDLVSRHSRPGEGFLEIGCGTGYVLRALASQCGLAVTGTELHGEGLEHARRRVPDARLLELDACEMPFRDEFDLIGAFDVLEHIGPDVDALRGMRRALRPGGTVFVTVPQHRWLWSAADDHARHVRRYRRGELLARMRQSGFEVVRVTSFVATLLPAMALMRIWRRRPPKDYDPLAELVPGRFNRALEKALLAECALIRSGLNLPAGGSLVVVGRRPR